MNESPEHNQWLGPWTLTIFFIGYWLVLLVATHLPSEFPLVPSDGTDKLVHFGAFAVLGGLFAATWEWSTGRLTARHLFVAWIVLALYAAFDEVTQPLFGRSRSLGDWLADAIGIVTGLLLFLVWRRWTS